MRTSLIVIAAKGCDIMDEEELKKIIKKTVDAALDQERRNQRGKVLYNTRALMEQYRDMREYISAAVSEVEEMEDDEFEIFKVENTHLESIRRTKLKTALMIVNIDRAMESLRKEYEAKGMLYKFEAFRLHYIEGIPFENVSEILNCGRNTPSRWSKELTRRMSVKLFGVEGIEKW